MSKKWIVSAIQQPCGDENPQVNLDLSIAKIREAASAGADLVVLPELHLGKYFCQTEDYRVFDLAQTIPCFATQQLSEIAKELRIVIVSTIFERRAAGIYHNTAFVFDKDGSLAGKYRKMHIPDDPAFYEKYYFTPGDLGFRPIETSIGKLGVLICWDQWYPEAARLMALAGADILIYPTAIGWDVNDTTEEKARQLDAWITVQRGHAVANGLPVISCNRIGFETAPQSELGIDFWGNSFITGSQGEFLARATETESRVLIAEIDKMRTETVRRIWPFLRDRRIDAFDGLTKRFID